MFLLIWIACLAVFRIRNNTWPWTVLKASLLTLAIEVVLFGLTSLGY